jgi:hypothetical protein
MKRTVDFPQLQGLRSISRPVLALLVLALVLPVGTEPLSAAPLQTIMYQVYVTDVTAVSFVVTWTTQTAGDGHVDWGPTTALGSTASDSVTGTTAHQVLVSGLSVNTDYYFQARSGTIIDNNGGNYYKVTTGSSAFPPTPGKTAYGYVYQQNGTTAVPNAVVYLQLQDNDGSGDSGNSQWVTARTDASGVWSFDLVNVRQADGSAYFDFQDGTDNLRLVRQGGDEGVVGEDDNQVIESVPAAYPGEFNATLDAMPEGSPIVGHDHWGKSWSGSGTGLTLTSSNSTGLHGESSAVQGRGVYGHASATGGGSTGVYGLSSSSAGRGVVGYVNAGSGYTYGLLGLSNSTEGRGVFGSVDASSGFTYGVYGRSQSTSGTGVRGESTATTGTTTGVYGLSNSSAGRGVVGYVNAGSGYTYGLLGLSNSTDGRGIYGSADASSGYTYGVYGLSQSTSGRGVFGYTAAAGGTTYGVYGLSQSTSGRGVYGQASASGGGTTGVYGLSRSNAGRGVVGYVNAGSGYTYGLLGLSNSTDGRGVFGEATASSGHTIGVLGFTGSPDGWAGMFTTAVGNGVYIQAPSSKIGLQVAGNSQVLGVKSAVVRTDDGSRLLYAEESAEIWFSDYGFGHLQKGLAVVPIDLVFAQAVNLQKPYHVFVQVYGDAEVYVTGRTPGQFEVRALKGKPDVEFSYRLVARRLGYEDQRLERAPEADDDPYLYPEKRAEWEAKHGLLEPRPPEELMEPLPQEEAPELSLQEELPEPPPPEETESPVEGP